MTAAAASATGRLPRAWDAFDAYLFDIDGTLLHCADAVHYFAFCGALSAIAGRPLNLDGVVAHGNTDTGILRDAFLLAGIPEPIWRPRLAELHACMAGSVAAHQQEMCVNVLPQVVETLDHLRARGAVLGVATGNLRAIGETKLRRAGLLHLFNFAAWSDDFDNRADVFRSAVELARASAGQRAALCVIGDTPSDIRAAHANGLPVIAVATGIYSNEQLGAESPELCLRSLADLPLGHRRAA